jgi:integrase
MASIKRIGKDSLGVPIWEAVYRRTPGGKQVRRRFHLPAKADVEREVLLDSQRSGIGLKWSEGLKIYLEAKEREGCGILSLENVRYAVTMFVQRMGDIAIEDTTGPILQSYMAQASTPKVANHHRKEMLAVARYVLAHTAKIVAIPFERVPTLPARAEPREAIPPDKVMAYLDALPPHIRRPVEMVLYYGLRSSAVCNLSLDDIDGNFLSAMDKGRHKRRIPIDDMLSDIITNALAFRGKVKDGAKTDRLLVTSKGTAWNHRSLNHAAQKQWAKAGLSRKKIHEVRHTLGTLAGQHFAPGMVQAAMGHRSRRSAEAYFHPSEEMAAEVRRKIITEISQNGVKVDEIRGTEVAVSDGKNGELACPCYGHKLLLFKEKGRN